MACSHTSGSPGGVDGRRRRPARPWPPAGRRPRRSSRWRRALRPAPGRAPVPGASPRLPTTITRALRAAATIASRQPSGPWPNTTTVWPASTRARSTPPSAQASGSAKAARAAAVAGRSPTRLPRDQPGRQRDELAVGAVDEEQVLAQVGTAGPAQRAARRTAPSWRRPRGRPRARRARRRPRRPPVRRTRGRRRWARAGSSPDGRAASVLTSVPHVSAASMRSTTSPAAGAGIGTRSSRRSPGP